MEEDRISESNTARMAVAEYYQHVKDFLTENPSVEEVREFFLREKINEYQYFSLEVKARGTKQRSGIIFDVIQEKDLTEYLDVFFSLLPVIPSPFSRSLYVKQLISEGRLEYLIPIFRYYSHDVVRQLFGSYLSFIIENVHTDVFDLLVEGEYFRKHDDIVAAMYYASRYSNLHVLDYFLYKNEPVLPLYMVVAAFRGNMDVLNRLVMFGGAIDMEDDSGLSPIAAIIYNGDIEKIRKFLDFSPKVERADGKDNYPLILIMKYPALHPLVEQLIKMGADVNCRNLRGETPLRLSIGYPVVTRLLKSYGAKEDTRTTAWYR